MNVFSKIFNEFQKEIIEINYEPKEGYEEYKKELYKRGLRNKLITIDEHDRENICKHFQISNINKSDKYLEFVKIEPSEMLTISTDYRIGLYIKDENGKEIPDGTRILLNKYKVVVDKPAELERMYYYNIKLNNENFGFNFNRNVQINKDQRFAIGIDSKELNYIPKENIEFKIIADYWTENTK